MLRWVLNVADNPTGNSLFIDIKIWLFKRRWLSFAQGLTILLSESIYFLLSAINQLLIILRQNIVWLSTYFLLFLTFLLDLVAGIYTSSTFINGFICSISLSVEVIARRIRYLINIFFVLIVIFNDYIICITSPKLIKYGSKLSRLVKIFLIN